MIFHAAILTLFPEMFPGTLGHSLAGKALRDGKWGYDAVDIRSFASDKHRTVDDHLAGGGAGMVFKPDILAKAIDATPHKGPRLLMSPRGTPLTQVRVSELAAGEGCMIICGRFEGIDQRVIDARGLQEVSVGDYVLSGGEPAALTLLDAVIRLLPGVMGHKQSYAEESFEDGLLEHPHYTKPNTWEGLDIPVILQSGDHKAIAKWKAAQRVELTKARRPDLYDKFIKGQSK
ncbi:MAG: tRNA (guanosine(37)-N1)-methyltransferase TrmD [Pseudomonadota bacterium]|nr:tRNA (guanosine(37)-N1)-methyltransferase TrmD [Pseudomonadota bacterium]